MIGTHLQSSVEYNNIENYSGDHFSVRMNYVPIRLAKGTITTGTNSEHISSSKVCVNREYSDKLLILF